MDINKKDENGKTAFHLACENGMTKTIKIMLDNSESYNLDIMAKDNNEKTGLQLATDQGKTDAVDLIKRKLRKMKTQAI